MINQNYELKNERIKKAFQDLKARYPDRLKPPLNLSWSNWGFGIEPLEESAKRLHKEGVDFIELHGNHYGPDLGYSLKETRETLNKYGLKVSGICGMFGHDNDLSSNRPVHRQAAIDYLKREIEFTAEIGGTYILVVPGAVGRPAAYDSTEFERSIETLLRVADLFVQSGVKAAIEPIRSAEVSFIHTFDEAKKYIAAIDHPGVMHINGDVYHMQSEESHTGQAIIDAGDMLVNLHMADSNRLALGMGMLDLDMIIMALYVIGYNQKGRYVTAEPLGPGGDPYPAMYGKQDKDTLDLLVSQTVSYLRQREEFLLSDTI